MMKKAADTYITHVFTNASRSIFLYYNVVITLLAVVIAKLLL